MSRIPSYPDVESREEVLAPPADVGARPDGGADLDGVTGLLDVLHRRDGVGAGRERRAGQRPG